MVISDEIKFPKTIQVEPFRPEKKVEAVDGAMPIARIGAFKREWNRRRGAERIGKESAPLNADEREAVRLLVEQVNTTLVDHHVLLHLVLVETEEGYVLDIYDCTGEDRCNVIKDIVIGFDDLPVLLRNLQDEAGLLIDTIS